MVDPTHYISAGVVPAVMISASGLIVLALYNRLAIIVARLRSLLRERLRSGELAKAFDLPTLSVLQEEQINHWLERMLDRETERVLHRARLVRSALFCLIAAIMCMALCSLTGGLATLWMGFSVVAIGLFILGQLLLIAGVAFALVELTQALHPVEIESRVIETMLESIEHKEE